MGFDGLMFKNLAFGKSALGFQEIIRLDACLFEDSTECPFREISGMVGNCCISIRLVIDPDLMASGGIAIKNKSKATQLFYDLCILKAGQSAHI